MRPLVPLAAFLMSAALPAAACLPGMVDIGGKFCIDKYEASLVEVRGNRDIPWSPFHVPSATVTYRADNALARIPQGYISGAQAQKACENTGKRLCTAAEWLAACQGPKKATYPYDGGSIYRLGACNEHTKDPKYVGPLQRLHNGKPSYDSKTMNDPRINNLTGTLLPSGTKADCGGAYGVYDMVGNLHEWVSDRTDKGNGKFKGGYYNEAELNGPGCLYTTSAHAFTYEDYSTGFRCCANP